MANPKLKRRPRGRPPGSSSQYRTIAADLTSRLAAGEWPIGKPIPSYRQLALHYQTGIHTIQLALKDLAVDGHVIIQPGRPPVAALGASLSAVMSGTIAIVLPVGFYDVLETPYRLDLIRGVANIAQRDGFPLLMLQDTRRWRTEFPTGLRYLPLTGIILLGPLPNAVLQQYEKLECPVVLLDQPAQASKLHSVAVDNYNSAFDAASRLIARGHRRIAYIRTITYSVRDIDPDAKERHSGFLAACAKAELEKDEFKVYSMSFGNLKPSLQKVLTAKPRISAAICDSIAISEIAAHAGLVVPRDLSLATYMTKGTSGENSGPQIDFELMGRTALEVILRNPPAPEHIRIPTKWKEGKSIATLPARFNR